MVIPKSAVRSEGGSDVVFVFQNGRAERRAVIVAGTQGDDSTLSTGVTAGDKVIVVAYGQLDASEARNYAPNVVLLDDGNRVKSAA